MTLKKILGLGGVETPREDLSLEQKKQSLMKDVEYCKVLMDRLYSTNSFNKKSCINFLKKNKIEADKSTVTDLLIGFFDDFIPDINEDNVLVSEEYIKEVKAFLNASTTRTVMRDVEDVIKVS